MSYAKFADAFKACKDLLTKPHPDATKIELKGSAAGGPTFIAEALIGAVPKVMDSAGKVKVSDKAVIATRAENAFAVSNFNVDKVSVNSFGVVGTEFSLSEVVKGTKLSFMAEDSLRHPDPTKAAVKAEFTVEHKAERATVTAVADVLGKGVTATAVSGHQGVFAGVSAEYTLADRLRDYSFVLGYKTGATTFGVATVSDKSTDKAGVVTKTPLFFIEASYHQKINPTVEIAGSVRVPRSRELKAVDIAAGLTYKYASDTTLAAKLAYAGKDGSRRGLFSYAQQVSPLAKVTIGADLNVAELQGEDHRLNIALALSA